MKTIEEIKARYAAEITNAEQEQRITALLPTTPKQVCIQSNFSSVKYGKEYSNRYTFAEALEIMRKFAPGQVIESEHWKSGCLSVRPAEINEYAKEESATMDGASYAEITLNAGRGYSCHELSFWWKTTAGDLLSVAVEFSPPHKWSPECEFRYDVHGSCAVSKVTPAFIGEDQRIKWWSPEGSYRISYYWADMYNFNAWVSAELEAKP